MTWPERFPLEMEWELPDGLKLTDHSIAPVQKTQPQWTVRGDVWRADHQSQPVI
jgi:hypothetical protein